jgi:hypothetical protein
VQRVGVVEWSLRDLGPPEWSLRSGFLGVSGSGASTLICDVRLLNVITGLRILVRRIVGGVL